MANNQKRKLQVFISSTYEDMKAERQAAVEAILQAGHIPAGMELFTSGDETQMQVIRNWIDDSDVFLLILGCRYGSIEKDTKKSYIHLEYEYAQQTKPYFSCVIKDCEREKRLKQSPLSQTDRLNEQEYINFRNEVMSKHVKEYEDIKDIHIIIQRKMNDYERKNALVGWIRPINQIDNVELMNAIASLTKENRELREKLPNASNDTILNLTIEEWDALLGLNGLNIKFLSGSMLRIKDFTDDEVRELKYHNLIESDEGYTYFTDEAQLLGKKMYAQSIIRQRKRFDDVINKNKKS